MPPGAGHEWRRTISARQIISPSDRAAIAVQAKERLTFGIPIAGIAGSAGRRSDRRATNGVSSNGLSGLRKLSSHSGRRPRESANDAIMRDDVALATEGIEEL